MTQLVIVRVAGAEADMVNISEQYTLLVWEINPHLTACMFMYPIGALPMEARNWN